MSMLQPIASSQAERMNANHIKAKSTDGADLKQRRGDSVVRSCCGILKGMILCYKGGFVRSTYGANETQHGNRVDLDITQSLNQTFGRSIDFHHALNEFFPVCRPTMKVSMRANHGSNIFGVSNNLHFTEFFTKVLSESCYWTQQHFR